MTSLLVDRQRVVLVHELTTTMQSLPQHVGRMLLAIIGGGSIYGAVLGSWHGARLSLYVAFKIPILLIATASLTSLFNFVSAGLLGLHLRFGQIFAMTLLPLAIASLVAGSIAPAVWLFTTSLPAPSETQRTLHNLLYLVHVTVIGSAGFIGTSRLGVSLLDLTGDARRSWQIRAAWVIAYGFVGGEIAWILRPFVGSIYLPVAFIREGAMHGNVYEFIFTDIAPHLIRRVFN